MLVWGSNPEIPVGCLNPRTDKHKYRSTKTGGGWPINSLPLLVHKLSIIQGTVTHFSLYNNVSTYYRIFPHLFTIAVSRSERDIFPYPFYYCSLKVRKGHSPSKPPHQMGPLGPVLGLDLYGGKLSDTEISTVLSYFLPKFDCYTSLDPSGCVTFTTHFYTEPCVISRLC